MEEIDSGGSDSVSSADPKPENPLAFPVGIPATPDNACWLNEGMTLLDYFAAHAPISFADAKEYCRSSMEGDVTHEKVMKVLAQMRSAYADEMLKMRKCD